MSIKQFRGSKFLVDTIKSRMEDIIKMYGFVTVADYFEIIGCVSTYTDNKIGWLSLSKAEIIMTDDTGTYELVLPKPKPLPID